MTTERQVIIEPPRKRFLKRRGNDEDKNILEDERKKRWAKEALRERRKRFEEHYKQSQMNESIAEISKHQDKIHDCNMQDEKDERRHQ